MKKLVSVLTALLLILSVGVLGENALNATDQAKALVPSNAEYLYTEKDGEFFEVHFLSNETGEEFEITVPVSGESPLKLETELKGEKGSSSSILPDESAKSAVLAEYPNAEIDSVLRVKEDGLFEIHVYFKEAALHGLMELNAETGRILERKVVFLAPFDGWQTSLSDDYAEDKSSFEAGAENNKSSSSESSSSERISVSQAKSVITSRYPGARITDIELDKENGKYVYEGEAVYNGREYDFEIDASTGKLRQWERDD